MRKLVPIVVLIAAGAVAGVLYVRGRQRPTYYTGFVEGEERVIRSEVTGRVRAIRFAEGDAVPAGAVIAVLDDDDISARIASKRQELAVLDADIQTQAERLELVERTWKRDVSARQAELRQAQSAADLAERTLTRERDLAKTGATTAQLLDDNRARRDQARTGVDRARELLARSEAEERSITVARHELEAARAKRALATAQLNELEVVHGKYTIGAPQVPTSVQTQYIWPGELAQPGAAIVAVLDPSDKYVQIYLPASDMSRLHLGQPVDIELDSRPGVRIPGEISFIADQANFTPEKIETRSDRVGQVYRAKVRILREAERLQPGAEGNVYLRADGTSAPPA